MMIYSLLVEEDCDNDILLKEENDKIIKVLQLYRDLMNLNTEDCNF
jgi:hypothetical protein